MHTKGAASDPNRSKNLDDLRDMMRELWDYPVPSECQRDPPQLSIDLLDLLNMSLGPSSVLRLLRSGPCLAFRRPWSGA